MLFRRPAFEQADRVFANFAGELSSKENPLRDAIGQARPHASAEKQIEWRLEVVGALGKKLAFLREEKLEAGDTDVRFVGFRVGKIRIDGEMWCQVCGVAP